MSDTFTPDAPSGAPDASAAPSAPPAPDASPSPSAPEPGQAPAGHADPEDGDDHGEAAGDAGDAAGKPTRAERRISRLTSEKYAAQREAAYWRGIAEQAQRGGGATQSPAAPGQPTSQPKAQPLPPDVAQWLGEAPRAADYPAGEFDPGYLRAAAVHDMRAEQARTFVQHRQHAAAQQQTAAQQQIGQKIGAMFSAGAAAYPDFAAVVTNEEVPLPQHVVVELIEHEKPEAIAYHLAKNPSDAARLAGLQGRALTRELTRIADKVSAAPPPPKSTSAPPPPPRATPGGGAGNRNPADMTMEEYAAWANGSGR